MQSIYARTNKTDQKFRYHLQSKQNTPNNSPHRRNLYLIDDDEADLFFSSYVLGKSNQINHVYKTNTPNNLFETLNNHGLFSETQANPEQLPVILIDIHMPSMNGIEMLSFIKDHPIISHLPVILLTGDCSGSKIPDAYRLKARGYLEKPLNIGRFHDILDRIDKGDHKLSLGDYQQA